MIRIISVGKKKGTFASLKEHAAGTLVLRRLFVYMRIYMRHLMKYTRICGASYKFFEKIVRRIPH
jgi:hypothetical protein